MAHREVGPERCVVKSIQYRKSLPRFLWTRLLSTISPAWTLGPGSLIHLTDMDPPPLPGPNWVRIRPHLAGICGSDLAAVRARSTPYFSPLISTPFVPGHEVVGVIDEVGQGIDDLSPGERVIIEPALHCAVRELETPCKPCQAGDTGLCERTTDGEIDRGIQTGYCRSTGGGWSPSLVAHRRQVHPVPEGWSDAAAVLVEPFACAIHAVASEPPRSGESILVMGCGPIGLLLIAAIRGLGYENPILASARWEHQGEWALRLGATERVPTGRALYEEIARRTDGRCHPTDLGPPILVGGVGLVYDCVASARSIDQAIRLVRPRGRLVLVGMPGIPRGVDWTGVWYRETRIRGTYAYGTETIGEDRRRTFEIAIDLMGERAETLSPLVTNRFSLEEYRRALALAMTAGRNGALKVAFEFPREQPREQRER